jgi:hypothetical protein
MSRAGSDFDFVYGDWRIDNRRLTDPLDPACTDWVRFPATLRAEPILGGLGHIDHYDAPELPGGGLRGCALRLYDPERDVWRDWWTSTARPGHLDPPLEGRFQDGIGRFEVDDIIDGKPVRVRFLWTAITATSARWDQAFSFDGGDRWHDNWTMLYRRA